MGVQNKMSIDLPFWYNVNRQTNIARKECNAHEHYTLLT